MKILVDTSVWSEALRRKKNKIDSGHSFLFQLINNDEHIILTGIILLEILSGITDNKLFNKIKNILQDFEFVEPEKEDYIYSTELRNNLKKKGISSGAIDFLIASIAIRNEFYLVSYDKDFQNISTHSDLKLINIEEYQKIKEKS